MNDDLKIIFDEVVKIDSRLTSIEVKQEERHQSNVVKMSKLDNLDCAAHVERMRWQNKWLGGLTGVVGIVIGWIATLHFWK